MEEQKWGKDNLLEGMASIIARGRRLACMHALDFTLARDEAESAVESEGAALVEAWYEAISGVIPCQHWKEVGLWTSRYTNPSDKFTVRQFFEAWAKFCEQGKARGYEPWR
jgi:hypothetical protein